MASRSKSTAYDAIIRDAKADRHGVGVAHVKDINEAPEDMEDLARYFSGLDARRLAGSWVACITDASREAFSTGDIARALCVVAERLHGATFTEPLLIPLPGEAAMPEPTTTDDKVSIQINDGPPPMPKAGNRYDPIKETISKLQPGQWILIPKSRLTRQSVTNKVAAVKTAKKWNDLRSYTNLNGDSVVIREKLEKA